MDDLRTRAQLVAYDRAGSIGTVVARAEIAEAAAGDEFPATLLLDLAKVEAADGGEITAHARVAVDWDEETLKRLLASTEDPELELRFDEQELVRAFEDVEAHGLRQRAAALTIAVAAAGVSSSPALARVAVDSGGAGGAATTGVGLTSQVGDQGLAAHVGGAWRALQQDEKLTQGLSNSTGTGQPAAVSSRDDSTLSTGELAAAVAGGVLLISAAGFGVSRKRTPPAQPA